MSAFRPEADWRESSSCQHCGSSVRFRHVIHCLTRGLLGKACALPSLVRQRYRGIGLSDAVHYAGALMETFEYVNTFYDREPMLDIADPQANWSKVDFIISSDVFEHVPAPVQRAFDSTAQLLAPGGLLVLTVPYFPDDRHTVEHFPRLGTFKIVELGGEQILVNKCLSSGELTVHRDLCFHGGDGLTLEMRQFGLSDIVTHLEQAGFKDIKVWSEAVPEWGIFPPERYSAPVTARVP